MTKFADRHIGPDQRQIEAMLEKLGCSSLSELMKSAVPENIRSKSALDLPAPVSEHEVLNIARALASKNKVFRSFLGMGYSDCIVPPVIQRNILENPGWYTQYTPYQSEISQGRLEALLNFQTMVSDLTGLAVSNASLLDEATAAAEGMTLCYGARDGDGRNTFLVSQDCHPQTIDVVKTRAEALGIRVSVMSHSRFEFGPTVFGALFQYPASTGAVIDYTALIAKARDAGVRTVVAADLLSLVLLKTPGEMGADVAVGSTQRFGVPLGYGGPHAAYLSTHDEFKRRIPGRIVGVSRDREGRAAYRLALQTREQHIRREKATSNICTAQVLLAIMASMYAVYHGPAGLRRIAERVHALAVMLATELKKLGYGLGSEPFFDTLEVFMGDRPTSQTLERVMSAALAKGINLRKIDSNRIGISLDETATEEDLRDLVEVFGGTPGAALSKARSATAGDFSIPAALARRAPCLAHPVFNEYHSETELLRYIRRLERKDLSLTTSMIPLGSCTMKLNAAAEMLPITWPGFSSIHPFAPMEQARGYHELMDELDQMLCSITGFDRVSLQPNAGSQGEYAGLLVIRKHFQVRGEAHRDVCLIPQSAHGTNPASAAMAGMRVVVVKCDTSGNVDLADLRLKAKEHAASLAALMITYPSTHGVFEEPIREICEIVHQHGGQVYMDGANLNAQIGLCRPADFGVDVCHLNLHKTFCIPHGGGGPGMGPIGVKKHLAPYLPTHPVMSTGGKDGIGAISAAPWGSPGILPISWSYIRMMGTEGLAHATQIAILNANYIACRLDPHFPVLYRGPGGRVAHECIVDLRELKARTGVEVEDVAKRLMDYGFHAPTVSFPVAGTLMIEPTESESKAELDRFCDAMIAIRGEIREIEEGKADRANNPLKHAPHTVDTVTADRWDRPYSREKAAFPLAWVRERKFWPAVARVDNVLGDRNLVCVCPPIEAYES